MDTNLFINPQSLRGGQVSAHLSKHYASDFFVLEQWERMTCFTVTGQYCVIICAIVKMKLHFLEE